MSYIGKAPGFGIRNRYYYTATAAQTTFSGADDNGQTLAYADSKYLDVFLNGVLLVAGTDYTATTLTSVTLTSGASAADIIEIVAYDIFSVADTVSAANGGTFNGSITIDGGLSVDGGTIKLDGDYPVATANVALGNAALDDGSLSGNANVAIGTAALTANTSGAANTAVGRSALAANTTASDNTAVGYQSLTTNTTGTRNVGVGYNTLSLNSTANDNTAVGHDALDVNTTGASNTALGSSALGSNTTASENTAVGYNALTANTTGPNNTAVGKGALDANTTGGGNTAVGVDAGGAITTGFYNTCIGIDAGESITTSSDNTMIGRFAGNETTGSDNTFLGKNSGYLVTTGSANTILGMYNGNQGGLDIRTSSNNIVLSDGSGNPRQIINSDGKAIFGKTAFGQVLTNGIELNPDNTGFISMCGDSSGNPCLYLANKGASGTRNLAFFYNATSLVGSISHNGSTTSYNTSSDYRLKENVTDITDGIDRLKQLPVHKFNFIADPEKTVDGFLAHEAQAVVPEAVTGTKDEVDEDGNPVMQGIDQSKLVPLLTAALKEAITEIETLKERVTALENQ